MKQQPFVPLIHQLGLLAQAVNESPYISREERLDIEKEIYDLSIQVEEGRIAFPQGEKTVMFLNKRAAVDEIVTLSAKIHYLNPASSRLESLRSLEKELRSDVISPEQARQKLQVLMHI